MVFPGAEGFGVESLAGRGGEIIRVTSLNDSGSGSLRAAIESKGPRIIVFEVSGNILLDDHIEIVSPYITIAGQTAPSPGITLRGAGIVIKTHDVLLQHIRIRPGDDPDGPDPSNRDALQILERSSYNVVVDHITASWAIDENLSIGNGAHDVTIRNSIIAEGLSHSLHASGEHSKGILIGENTENIILIGNLMAHNRERLPRVKGGVSLIMANNLIYNGQNYMTMGSPNSPSWVSALGNVFIHGPNSSEHKVAFQVREGSVAGTEIYMTDNVATGPLFKYYTPFDPQVPVPPICAPLEIRDNGSVEDWVLTNSGARPADRDGVDKRLVGEVKTRSGHFINSPSEVSGWPKLPENYREFLAPIDPDDDDDDDGYTNMEELLHQMAAEVEGKISV